MNLSELDSVQIETPKPNEYEDRTETMQDDLLRLLTIDGYDVGGGALAIQCIAICIFGAQITFAVFNAVKFYRHRSYALGLFYVLTISNFLFRMSFFVAAYLGCLGGPVP